jgi:hypothetical protein
MFTQGQALCDEIDFAALPCGLEQLPLTELKTLHLSLGCRSGKLNWGAETRSQAVMPLLSRNHTSLQTLSIRSDLRYLDMRSDSELAVADPILKVKFPNLSQLLLCSLGMFVYAAMLV